MFPKIKTASKLESFLARSFGKINTSEDSGVVTVISKWRGKYYVLSQTRAQQSLHPTPPNAELKLDSGVAYAERKSKLARKSAGG